MASGSNSTLRLHPHGGESLTLLANRASLQDGETYIYLVDLGRLNLNEAERIQWEYDTSRDGGQATDRTGGLVPVVLSITIRAATAAARIAGYNALKAAVTNRRGGTLEYAPEGVGVSTFYHYLPSAAPRLEASVRNRWDQDPVADRLYDLYVEVELQTQPLATSDPDPATPVDLMDAAQPNKTIIPGEGTYAQIGLTDKFSIDNLGGSEPVLTRILAYGAGGQDVGRVIAFRKTGAGKDADHVMDSALASVISGGSYWTTVNDAARYGGSYRRLQPPVDKNGTEYTHRYTLSNPAYWEGTFAVFVIGYDESWVSGAWTHKAALRLGDKTVQESAAHYARLYGNWQLVYVGELTLPPTELSLAEQEAGYGATCYIDIVSARGSGAAGFRFDALVLVQVLDAEGAGAVLDVVCDGEDAVTPTERLVIENMVGEAGQPLEVAHVLSTGDLAFLRTLSVAPRGEFLALDPGEEHTVRLLHEWAQAEPYAEDLESYDGRYFEQLGTFWSADKRWPFSSYEGWALASGSRNAEFAIEENYFLEGWYVGGIVATTDLSSAGYGRIERAYGADYGGETSVFTEDDMLCYSRWWDHVHSEVTHARVGFIDASGVMAYTTIQTLTTGAVNRCVRRSDLTSALRINWGAIQKIFVDYGVQAGAGNLNSKLWIDHIRVEKRDDAKPSEPNVTGGQWSFDDGKVWSLTTDTARNALSWWPEGWTVDGYRRDPGMTLACVGMDGARHTALLNEEAPEYAQFSARLSNQNQSSGYIGFAWCTDDSYLTAGQNAYEVGILVDGYDLSGVVYLYKYIGGAYSRPNGIGEGDNVLFIWGAHFREPWLVGARVNRATGATEVYLVPEGMTTCDNDLWSADNLRWSYTDTDHMSNNKCGLMTGDYGKIRADKILLRDAHDRIDVAKALNVAIQGQYRTVTPLAE